jgi:hypothetical protein
VDRQGGLITVADGFLRTCEGGTDRTYAYLLVEHRLQRGNLLTGIQADLALATDHLIRQPYAIRGWVAVTKNTRAPPKTMRLTLTLPRRSVSTRGAYRSMYLSENAKSALNRHTSGAQTVPDWQRRPRGGSAAARCRRPLRR